MAKTRSPIVVKRDLRMKKLFSTGQIADLIGVCAKVVAGWIDTGKLKGLTLPGSTNERRVHRDELRAFLIAHNFDYALRELDQDMVKPVRKPAASLRRAALGQVPRRNGTAMAGRD